MRAHIATVPLARRGPAALAAAYLRGTVIEAADKVVANARAELAEAEAALAAARGAR